MDRWLIILLALSIAVAAAGAIYLYHRLPWPGPGAASTKTSINVSITPLPGPAASIPWAGIEKGPRNGSPEAVIALTLENHGDETLVAGNITVEKLTLLLADGDKLQLYNISPGNTAPHMKLEPYTSYTLTLHIALAGARAAEAVAVEEAVVNLYFNTTRYTCIYRG